MSNDDSSLVKCLKEASDDAAAAPAGFSFAAGAQQMELLRGDDGRLPHDAAHSIRQNRYGPGRRPGSRNKRNAKISKWYIEKYGDPLAALGEIINTSPAQIYDMMLLAQGGEAEGKRVTGRDALEFWKSAVMGVLPYVHGKQPISIDVSTKADAVIFIPGLNAPDGFTAKDLEKATDALGIDAIEREGIRLEDGSLLRADGQIDAEDDPQ